MLKDDTPEYVTTKTSESSVRSILPRKTLALLGCVGKHCPMLVTTRTHAYLEFGNISYF
jgi:hypothetical protein